MKDINQLLDRLMTSLEAIEERIAAVEASVLDSAARAQKTERLMFGEPQPTKPRPLTPAVKGSIQSKSLGLG